MPAEKFRDRYYSALGGKHAYKAGTAHTTAQTVVAAVTGKSIQVKAFRCVASIDVSTPADLALNALWLSDGLTTPILAVIQFPALDATSVNNPLAWDTGVVVLPGEGVKGTAATALTIDATAISTVHAFMIDVWYDEV